MKQYLGVTARKALKTAELTDMSDGTRQLSLVLRGLRYIVSKHTVETYTGHADVVVLDGVEDRIVLYA